MQSPSCQAVLADPFFGGEGRVALAASSAGTLGCSLDFRGNSPVLPKLGINSRCNHADASITIAVDVDIQDRTWRYDRQETESLDNGDCLG